MDFDGTSLHRVRSSFLMRTFHAHPSRVLAPIGPSTSSLWTTTSSPLTLRACLRHQLGLACLLFVAGAVITIGDVPLQVTWLHNTRPECMTSAGIWNLLTHGRSCGMHSWASSFSVFAQMFALSIQSGSRILLPSTEHRRDIFPTWRGIDGFCIVSTQR